jgi:hypothetical protein
MDLNYTPQIMMDEWNDLFNSIRTGAARYLETHGNESTGRKLWDLAVRDSEGEGAPRVLYSAALSHLIGHCVVELMNKIMTSEIYHLLNFDLELELSSVYSEMLLCLQRSDLEGPSQFTEWVDENIDVVERDFRSKYQLGDFQLRDYLISALEILLRIKIRKPLASLVVPQPGAPFNEAIMNGDLIYSVTSDPVQEPLSTGDRSAIASFCIFPGVIDAHANTVLSRSYVWLRESPQNSN